MTGWLRELDEPAVLALLATLVAFMICAGLMGWFWPIVCGVLIAIAIHLSYSKPFTKLTLSDRDKSEPHA